MALTVAFLVLLVVVIVLSVLVFQIASLNWRVRDVERKLNELRIGASREASPATAAPPVMAAPVSAPASTPPRPAEPAVAWAPVPVTIAALPAAPAVATTTPGRQWEVLVGTNWLNKLGVLVFVVGVALLVRYSIAHVGPAGRIAIGFVASGALLAIGLGVARLDRYRTFGRGLVAGGWAGTYFTTFAMHGIPAARIINSDLLGTALLLVVAGAMTLHALAARSQAMTALAFVAGYATIVLSPLTMFAAAAVVPLAAATAIVAARFGWSRVALLGAAATYALFPIREALHAPLLIDRDSPALYAMLGLYWLVFEAADVVGARRRGGADRGLELFVVNVLGALGVAVLELPRDDSGFVAAVLASGALAYLISATVRVWQGRVGGALVVGVERLTSTHLAVAASAALMAMAALTRFTDTRATLVLLFETELVLASAVALGDRIVRAIALGVAVLVTYVAIGLAAEASFRPLAGGLDATTWSVAAVALVWYANREWLRRTASPDPFDIGYSWAGATIATVLVIAQSTSVTGAFVLLGIGAALLEAGLRRRDDYRQQAYVVCALATLWIVRYFLQVPPPDDAIAYAWRVLPPAAFLMGALALHLSRRRQLMEMRVAAIIAAWATMAFVAIFELRVIGHHANAAAWAFTGFALTTIGTLRSSATLRWQGYALASAGALASVATDLADGRWDDFLWAAAAVAALYGVCLVTRPLRTPGGVEEPASRWIERYVREAEACLATLRVFLLWAQHGGENRITLDWGLTAIALLTTGTTLRERTLRWCGLAGLLSCVVRLTFHDLAQLEAPARITVFVVLGLVLIGASWIYTRFRERVS